MRLAREGRESASGSRRGAAFGAPPLTVLVGDVDELLDEARLDVEVEHHEHAAHLLARERPRLVLVEETEAAADLRGQREGRER